MIPDNIKINLCGNGCNQVRALDRLEVLLKDDIEFIGLRQRWLEKEIGHERFINSLKKLIGV